MGPGIGGQWIFYAPLRRYSLRPFIYKNLSLELLFCPIYYFKAIELCSELAPPAVTTLQISRNKQHEEK